MARSINKRFKKFTEDMGTYEFADSLYEYYKETIDIMFLEGNKKQGMERIKIICKLVEDHSYQHPYACFFALSAGDLHLIDVLLFLHEHNQKKTSYHGVFPNRTTLGHP